MILTENHIEKLFSDFNRLRVMVIGDVMIDSYLNGVVERMSPEAPVPVVSVQSRYNRLGGAANVTLNIKAMGAEPVLCSVIGKDAKAGTFLDLMKEFDLVSEGIIQSDERITTVKERILGNRKQLIRIDEENTHDLSKNELNLLLGRIVEILNSEKIDAIILQDYNKGVLSKELIEKVIELANERRIPITVDPKKKNFLTYKNVTLFKPNAKELGEGMEITFTSNAIGEIEEAALKLQNHLHCRYVMATLSELGVMICDGDKSHSIHIPAHLRTIADVSGAGDTVLSIATLCLAAHEEPFVIAALSNIAGGLVCEESGVVPINKMKLRKEVTHFYSKNA